MLIAVDEEVLEGFEIERKWRNHINNSNMPAMHKEKQALKEKLEIAVKALEFYANESHFGDTQYGINGENECWYEGNVENGTKAQEALAKIKEIK